MPQTQSEQVALCALRLTRPDTRVISGPFPVVEIDDYLPNDVYQELLETYPNASEIGFHHTMKNYLESGASAFETFVSNNSAWARFISYMDSDEFLLHVYEFARPLILAGRGRQGARPWCRNGVPLGEAQNGDTSTLTKLTRRLLYTEVATEFQLSSMERGHRITPHSDSAYKLVSVMVYFPFPDWSPDWGGGTQFFQPKSPEAKARWCNSRVNHVKQFGEAGLEQFSTDMACFHTAPFAPNQFVMFCKSNDTFHAVDEIRCPPDRRRNALIFNINVKKTKKHSWLGKRVDQVRKWSQATKPSLAGDYD